MVKERPILFSGPMVRALLEDRKTQTRRIIKPQPTGRIDPVWSYGPKGAEVAFGPDNLRADGGPRWWRVPYGQIGDRLWVREAMAGADDPAYKHLVKYRANGDHATRWRPSIHMPRWASRILLEITGIRFERVQEISEADTQAEGVPDVDHYRCLWESLHGRIGETWGHNPWVWVVEFKRVEVGYIPVPCLVCAGTGREHERKRTCTICQGAGKVCPGCNGYSIPPQLQHPADDLCKVCGQYEVPF